MKVYQAVGFLPLLLGVVLYWGQTLVVEWEGQFGYGQVENYGLPAALMEQFRFYDSDANGFIDPFEFSILIQHLDQVLAVYFTDQQLVTLHGYKVFDSCSIG